MQNSHSLSRRQMLKVAGVSGAIATGAALAGCKKEEPAPAPAPEMIELTVYNPSGSTEITQLFSPRLDTIEGKTIAFVSNDSWEYDRTFAKLAELFAAKYPSVTIINWDQFKHGVDYITQAKNGIVDKMKELGVDAAIVGNAG